MIAWIRVSVAIAEDPAIARLAEAVGVSRPEAVGLVVGVLCKLPAHAKTGDLAAVPPTLLEDWAGWKGRRGRFAAAFRAELCDEAGIVLAWEALNGAPIREAEYDAARKRRARSAGRSDRHPADSPADVPRTVREMSTVTRRDVTKSRTTSGTSRDVPVEFETAWSSYPKRPNNPKREALTAWRTRVNRDKVAPAELQAAVERYAAYCVARGIVGTETVMQARTFFGPNERWKDDFDARPSERPSHRTPEHEHAAVLWERYAKYGCLQREISKQEWRTRAEKMVTDGLYATAEDAIAELRVTQPWDLNAKPDPVAIAAIRDRLARRTNLQVVA